MQKQEPTSFLTMFFFSPRKMTPIRTVERRKAVSAFVLTMEMFPFCKLQANKNIPLTAVILAMSIFLTYLRIILVESWIVFGIKIVGIIMIN